MALKPALNQFNGGEFNPKLEGRYDIEKYNYSSKLCQNFIPTIEGSLKRRGGSHFVYSPDVYESCWVEIVINCDSAPTVYVDGNLVPVSLYPLHTRKYTTGTIYVRKNSRLTYRVEAENCYTEYHVVNIRENTTIELTPTKGTPFTGTLYTFSDEVSVEVDGKVIEGDKFEFRPTYTGSYPITELPVRVRAFYKDKAADEYVVLKSSSVTQTSDYMLAVYMEDDILKVAISKINIELEAGKRHIYTVPACAFSLEVGVGGGGEAVESLSSGTHVGGGGAYADWCLLRLNRGETVECYAGKAGLTTMYDTKGETTYVTNLTETTYIKLGGGDNLYYDIKDDRPNTGAGGEADRSQNVIIEQNGEYYDGQRLSKDGMVANGKGDGTPGYVNSKYGWGYPKVLENGNHVQDGYLKGSFTYFRGDNDA